MAAETRWSSLLVAGDGALGLVQRGSRPDQVVMRLVVIGVELDRARTPIVVAHKTMVGREFRAAQVTVQIPRICTASSAPQLDTVTAPNGCSGASTATAACHGG